MRSVTDKVSAQERDNARMSRQSVTNPAEFEAGMDDDISDFDFGDDFGGSSGFGAGGQDSFGSGGFGSGDFGTGGFDSFGGQGFDGGRNNMWGQSGSFGTPNTSSQQDDGLEDKFFSLLKKFFIGFGSWTKHFIASFKEFDSVQKLFFGKSLIYTSLVCAVVGVIFLFFLSSWGKPLLLSSGLTLAIGVLVFMCTYDKLKKSGELNKMIEESQPEVEDLDISLDDENTSQNVVTDSEDFGSEEYNDDDDEYDDDPFGGLSFEEPLVIEDSAVKAPEVKSSEEVISSIDVDRGMITRQYLYESIVPTLPSCDPSFAQVREIPENSEEFDAWDALIRQIAELLKTKSQEEDMPYLISAKDKLFYTYLEIHRVKWLKNIDQFTDELVKICRYDEESGAEDDTIYGIGIAVGMKICIKIMKGETAMVSLRDAYSQVKDFVLDTKNYFPVVWGIDSEGKVVTSDLKHIDSMCIAGMPRKGKSWCVQAILTQMVMFHKPSEVQLYIFDPKDSTSDFKAMSTLPHVRDFRTRDEEVLEGLKRIVNVEAPRRMKLIGDANCVNIWDYKKKCPAIELPLLYVVIDEVITFSERMKDKSPESAKEFQSLLLQFVSRLPNLGIRLFMIPHVIKDQILKKTITDLIPCRASVCGNAQHIESTVGVKEKDFPYKLNHNGDMALRLDSDPKFVHGVVLSSSNEVNDEIFSFLTQLWLKIEPESYRGSALERFRYAEGFEDTIKKLHLENINLPDSSVESDKGTKVHDTRFEKQSKSVMSSKINMQWGNEVNQYEDDIDLDSSDEEFKLWDD